ncbi:MULTISPECIES: hypothetical protein [unclassified Saccharothrix]|uniref:hypothetical protein n=1 Tax=unclassified Saccharothrix TaxID=2593673 RepID=UPI00307D50C7
MRNLVRLVAATALSLPVLVGAAGLASADSAGYFGDTLGVGPLGLTYDDTDAGAHDGEAFYHNEHIHTGELGTFVGHTWSWADDGDHHGEHGDHDGPSAEHYGEVIHISPLGFFTHSHGSFAESD